ncbi:CPCC family cysteine-rich protein [Streptomycetaceae bacterium NBC_01309]
MSLTYPCVCCGHLTMQGPPGGHEICPVCFWEDDATQLRWPDLAGGANRISLIKAQQNYRAFGACDERVAGQVRPAEDDEPPDPAWRPIDPERDRFEPRGVALAPWPDERTVLYWWRYRNTGFWRPAPD